MLGLWVGDDGWQELGSLVEGVAFDDDSYFSSTGYDALPVSCR